MKKKLACIIIVFSFLSSAFLLNVSSASYGWNIQTVDSTGDVGKETSLALDTAGNPHISYTDSTNGDVKYAMWNGSSWSIDTVDSTLAYSFASLALDSADNPHIVYRVLSYLRYAMWNGYSWDTQDVYDAGSCLYMSLALDSNDYPHISCLQSGAPDLWYVMWNGSAWSVDTVDPTEYVGFDSSLALDSAGNPHISYYDFTNGDLKYAVWNGSGWNIQTVDSTGDVGKETSLALDSAGNPHISYRDFTNGDLKYAVWNGSGWDIQTVDSAGYVGYYSSLALDSAGNPHISYTDSTNVLSVLKYAVWNGSGWDIQTVDSAGSVGGYTSLALDSTDNPHISYYDVTNGDLKYAFFEPDTNPPTGSILINGGAQYATSTSVTLTLTHTDAESGVDQVKYSNDGVWDTEPWESPSATKAWTLTGGDGQKWVYYQIKDNAGLLSSTYSSTIFVDTVAPSAYLWINDGALTATSAFVTLTYSMADVGSGIDMVRYSNDGVWDTEAWEVSVVSKSWTLTAGDGSKTVYLQVRDFAGHTFTTSDSITLDTTPPTGSIVINGGDAYTTSTSVMLSLTHSDATTGVSHIRFSNDGVWDTEAWESTASSKAWTLSGGNGEKTVYYQVRDYAGNIMETSDSIILNASPTLYHDVVINGTIYVVETCSNSSVSDLTFNEVLKRLRFTVNGTDGTGGFCNITVPAELMSGDFSLYLDDVALVEGVDYTQSFNSTHYLFHVNYMHSSHLLELFSTVAIPDFVAWLFLPFLMSATLLGFALRKRLKKQRPD